MLGAFALAVLVAAPAFALPPPALPALPALPSNLAAATPFTALATVYAEDFELTDGGFTTGGAASWEYGTPVSPPTTVPGQGTGMWGTNIDGDYGNSECGWLQSAAIDLSAYPAAPGTGVSAARLAFRHWMHFEYRYDAGIMMASPDGETWSIIAPNGGYAVTPLTSARTCFGLDATGRAYTTPSAAPAADAWALAEFDVTPYLGGQLHLRWVFASDASVVKRGWYVDDVLVQVGAGAAATVPLPAVGPAPGVPFTPVATLYAEDFEGSDGGWTADGTMAWEWGAPAAPPVTLAGSLNVWGTRLNANYNPNECSALTSPAVSIPGASATGAEVARLSFRMWSATESGFDAAHLVASTDGGATWTRLVPADGYDRTLTSSFAAVTRACLGITTTDAVWSGGAPRDDEWTDVSFDVTSLMGSDAMFRIVFGSDGDTEARGVYIDDVLVQVGAGGSVSTNPTNPSLIAPGWTVTGNRPSWEYGFPAEGPASTRPVWATNLEGNYNANECSAIESVAIDTTAVPGLGRLQLTFEHWAKTASTADGGVVQVSTDGGATWARVTPVNGYGTTLSLDAADCLGSTAGFSGTTVHSVDWTARRVWLDSFQGQTIKVRFAFGSSPSSENSGWHLRSIGVDRGAGSVPLAMQVADVTPALFLKADERLRMAIESDPLGTFPVIIAGPAHEAVDGQDFADRAEAMAWLDAKAAPFMDGVKATAAAMGGKMVYEWSIVPGIMVEADLPLLKALAARDDVKSVTLDRKDAIRLIDPEVPEDQDVGTQNTEGRNMLQAEDIWALGFRGEGIKLAIIDTGIDGSHEAFKNADGSSRIAMWKDWVNGQAAPYDDQGHGTHVAGTSAGSNLYVDPTFGAFTQVGVAPRATLMGVKFLDSGGSGSFANGVNSINWSFVNGADITSNSWGASGCSSSAYPVMAAVRTTTDAGMLSVFAAGNSGPGAGSIGSPACSESALSVGAVDKNGVIASFSSRGPCADNEIGGSSRICPDIVAKGYLVLSSAPRGSCSLCNPSGYKVLNGTSMATPHASGAVVLAEQMKRFYTGAGWDTAARAEEEVFKLTALDLGPAGEDNTYGWGLPQLLNIYALLDSTDEANIISSFLVSDNEIRQGDSTLLKFSVRNLGGAVATGTFTATLTDPNGDVTVLKSSTPSLGILDGESYQQTLVVTGGVLPGDYTFAGTFDYSWTNGNGDVITGSVAHSGGFSVKRVFVAVSLEGLDARTTPGDLQTVTYTATNTGNEDANNVTIEFTVRDSYVFVPGAGFDPLDPNAANARYSNPPPTRVVEDRNFGRVTLIYTVGSLAQGETFSFTTNLLPTTPGTYTFLSVAKFRDGGGNAFSQGTLNTQTVGMP